MAKNDDAQTIAMRLEKGRLVPVTAYDLELLGQWHDGAELNVEAKRDQGAAAGAEVFRHAEHVAQGSRYAVGEQCQPRMKH